MKTALLVSSLIFAVSSALAAPNESATPSTPAPQSSPPAATVSSHVTITIDSGGKKVTREMDLGPEQAVKIHGSSAPKVYSSVISGSLQVTPTGLFPWLGVAPEEVSEELRAQLPLDEGTGLILRSILPESPAAQAGLQKNDVLVKFDDQILTNDKQLRTLVRLKKDGDKVRLTYFRGGKSSTTEAQIRMHEGDDSNVYTGVTVLSFAIGKADWTSNTGSTLNLTGITSQPVLMNGGSYVLTNTANLDLDAAVMKIEKTLRSAGVDEKTIAETKRILAETLKSAGGVAEKMGAANDEVVRQIKQTTEQVSKSLEKSRAAAEDARKKAEETRERILEKQEELKKTQ